MGKIVFVILALISIPDTARAEDIKSIPARLDCRALKSDSKSAAFTDRISFAYSRGMFKAGRSGLDAFTGSMDALGKIDLDGKWKFANDATEWEYHFSGQLVRTGVTVLRGGLKIVGDRQGERHCTILFELPANDLLKRLSPEN
jgi:hypothetical protein